MKLTSHETDALVTLIEPIFEHHLSKYSFEKYPATDYATYKSAYSKKNAVNDEISASLAWKWGHFGKDNFPSKQKALIKRIEALWAEYVKLPNCTNAESTFNWWRVKLPNTAYITAAYITHLVHHADPLPIIDQHNFRAMNSFIKQIRPDHEATKSPRNWEDISNLKHFMSALLEKLPGKSFGELDQFLMMYGRSIKPRKPIRKP